MGMLLSHVLTEDVLSTLLFKGWLMLTCVHPPS